MPFTKTDFSGNVQVLSNLNLLSQLFLTQFTWLAFVPGFLTGKQSCFSEQLHWIQDLCNRYGNNINVSIHSSGRSQCGIAIDVKEQLVHTIKPLCISPYFCISLYFICSYLYFMVNFCRTAVAASCLQGILPKTPHGCLKSPIPPNPVYTVFSYMHTYDKV